jgi:hypothetical protein
MPGHVDDVTTAGAWALLSVNGSPMRPPTGCADPANSYDVRPTRGCGILCTFASRRLIPKCIMISTTDSSVWTSEWHAFRTCSLPVEGMGVDAGSHEAGTLGILGDVTEDAEPRGWWSPESELPACATTASTHRGKKPEKPEPTGFPAGETVRLGIIAGNGTTAHSLDVM